MTAAPPTRRRPVVIGLVGGIGSGKSTVARILADLGAVVSDSDGEAKAVLQTPDVRDRLVARWGSGILAPDGTVDRATVAKVVFGNAAERAFLESIIHPALHARRQQRLAAAGAGGNPPPAFIIDAPLLFEAGVDRECGAVVFVDAPIHQRLARVAGSRGWSADELARREAAQIPLDEKRRRAGYTVANSGNEADLRRSVKSVFEAILAAYGESTAPHPPSPRSPA